LGTQSVIVRLLMLRGSTTNVMTGNMTKLGIETAGLLLAWRRRARERYDPKSEKEFVATRSRLLIVLAIAVGFFSAPLAGR
jgi:hypothetical protein